MISTTSDTLKSRAETWMDTLRQAGFKALIRPGQSATGGGSLPDETLPTWRLALPVERPAQVATQLRQPPLDSKLSPVIVKVENGQVLLDPRTVLPGQDALLLAALRQALET
jgi:L-seryl-tRNA(Ser) seleniumtransferase